MENINEAISPASVDRAALLISKYLKSKTGFTFFKYPGIESYSGKGSGFGIRFYTTKGLSVRLNWNDPGSMGLVGVASVDFWNKSKTPLHIKFDASASLVKILPMIAQVIADGGTNKKVLWSEPDGVGLNEDMSPRMSPRMLLESADAEEIVDGILDMIALPSFSKGMVHGKYKGAGTRIFDHLAMTYPELIVKSGTKYTWAGTPKDLQTLKKNKSKVIVAVGIISAKVSKGSSNEKYSVSAEITELENSRKRISFEMQLEDLERLLKLTVNGASNAIFVAGRGGVGKTHTVEKVLASLGKRDGAGYFKNTGSASAAGMYSLLFKYRNDIILFDDSDDALKDQESRNILKAATDTKKIRKLVWNKMGKNIVDPDEMSADEMIAQGLLPRFFDFTGRIIFISNLKLDKLDPDGALRTRAFLIDIDPTEAEIYDFMDRIVSDITLDDGLSLDLKSRKHVVDLLRKGGSKQSANLRKLSRGLNMAAGAIAAGVSISSSDLSRLIETYA